MDVRRYRAKISSNHGNARASIIPHSKRRLQRIALFHNKVETLRKGFYSQNAVERNQIREKFKGRPTQYLIALETHLKESTVEFNELTLKLQKEAEKLKIDSEKVGSF